MLKRGLHTQSAGWGKSKMYRQSEFSLDEAAVIIEDTMDHYVRTNGKPMPFYQVQTACHAAAVASGRWTSPEWPYCAPADRNVGSLLMLIVTEIAEAMEGHRKNLKDDKLPDRDMLEVELADAVIRIFDLAGACGYDLEDIILRKLAFNLKREDHTLEHRAGENGKRE